MRKGAGVVVNDIMTPDGNTFRKERELCTSNFALRIAE